MEGDAIWDVDAVAMKRELWIAVDRLPGELPEVIRKRYIDGQTLREVGKDLDLKYERVRQMEYKALRGLRQPGPSRKYRRYFEEYISAECCHHVGIKSFQRTWTSEVEREVLGWI